jgi:hypothetical protein
MCRLAWLYTGGKDLMLSGPALKGLKFIIALFLQKLTSFEFKFENKYSALYFIASLIWQYAS